MSHPFFLYLTLFLSFLNFSLAVAAPQVVIYAYDSLVGKASLGEALRKEFERTHDASVSFVPFGSAGEALNQIVLEGSKTRADLLMGIDNSLLARAVATGHFRELDKKHYWEPFDYGFPTLVYDQTRFSPKPGVTLLSISTEKKLRKKIALIDPRTSSLGRLFLVWTEALIPSVKFVEFWKSIAQNSLTISPGWSGAYSLFTHKEADLVLSYTTSPAYHMHFEKNENIKALIFSEGHIRQTEGVLFTRYSKQPVLAQKLVETLLGREIQTLIPLTQFMYPVRDDVKLPAVYARITKPVHWIDPQIPADLSPLIKRWNEAMTQ